MRISCRFGVVQMLNNLCTFLYINVIKWTIKHLFNVILLTLRIVNLRQLSGMHYNGYSDVFWSVSVEEIHFLKCEIAILLYETFDLLLSFSAGLFVDLNHFLGQFRSAFLTLQILSACGLC